MYKYNDKGQTSQIFIEKSQNLHEFFGILKMTLAKSIKITFIILENLKYRYLTCTVLTDNAS